MEFVHKIENKLYEVFKGAPPLPENARKAIVNVYPWIALIFGVLQLFAALAFWRLAHSANQLIDDLNRFSQYSGIDSGVRDIGLVWWLSFVAILVSAFLLLAAYPGLKARKKQGWDYLFIGVLVNFVHGVLLLFVGSYYGGFGDFIGSLIGVIIGLYILFQTREYYLGKKAVVADTKPTTSPAAKKNKK